jgi:uncharacterized membrane protein
MGRTLLIYTTALAVLVGLDVVWLGLVALDFYRRQLGDLLLERPRLGAAALFYLLYAAGVTVLAVQPALAAGDAWRALLSGALLGLCAYGAYEFTNLATLRHWPLRLVLVDIAWGTALTSVAALAGFLVARHGLPNG